MLMINTPPSERPPGQNAGPSHINQPKGLGHGFGRDDGSIMPHSRNMDDYTGAALFPAAAALAQLHNHKMESGWESEGVS